MNKEKMAAFITSLRKEKNLTQLQLAQTLNVTDKAVSKWERGQGIPDITIVSDLAAALGVSVGDLLNGERSGEQGDSPADPDSLVQTTLQYAQKAENQRRVGGKKIAFISLSLFLLIGVFVSVLCDFIITGQLSWSLYVVYSSVLAFAVSVPLIYGKKYRFLLSLLCLTVLILPYLFLLEPLTPVAGWAWPVGLPSALVMLAYLWVLCLLHTFTRISLWFLGAVAFFLCPAVNLPINHFISSPSTPLSIFLPILCSVVVGILLLIAGAYFRRRPSRS